MDKYLELSRKIDHLEFKQQLLWENTEVSRFIFNLDFTEDELKGIYTIFDEYRSKVENNEAITIGQLEHSCKQLLGNIKGDYQHIQLLVKMLYEDNRWVEVYENTYGKSEE